MHCFAGGPGGGKTWLSLLLNPSTECSRLPIKNFFFFRVLLVMKVEAFLHTLYSLWKEMRLTHLQAMQATAGTQA